MGLFMNINQKIKDDIARDGVSIISVMSDGENPGFAYTVGLWETYKHPELITVGLPPQAAHGIFGEVMRMLDKGEAIETMKRYDRLANLPLAFINVESKHKEQYMLMLDNHYGAESENIHAMQMLWPDPKGVLPYEAGYDSKYDEAQPMLGSVVVKGDVK